MSAAPHGKEPLRYGRGHGGSAPKPPATPRVPFAPRLLKEVPRVARREQPGWRQPVLTKPTGAGAGEHGPAGPGAPAGGQGEGKWRWRDPATAQAHSRRGGESGNWILLQGLLASGACAAQGTRRSARPPPPFLPGKGSRSSVGGVRLSGFCRLLRVPFRKATGGLRGRSGSITPVESAWQLIPRECRRGGHSG